MAKRKCVLCGEWIEDDTQSIPYKGRYAHIQCFNVAMKTIKKSKDEKLAEKSKSKTKAKAPKPKAELKDAVSEEEYADKKQYYQYLRTLIDDELSAKVYALSDQYISRYNFTFKEMYQTLVYLHEIVEKELVGDVVGLIPFYLSEAQNYFKSIEQVEEANKNIDVSKMYKEKVIVIQPKKRITKQLDIESIGKGEDNGS
jgi:hypothetical protein